MRGLLICEGVSIETGKVVEGYYFHAGNTDEHFILRDSYMVERGARKSGISTDAYMVYPDTIKIIENKTKETEDARN